METERIVYNLHERGRKYRGTPRQFDAAAIAAAINSDACQERVRHRDMQGYYGHWPRLKFGFNPQEGGLIGGHPALVEPALLTTYLQAHTDGRIEHQAEFLDTASGQVAAKLYHHRTGGFSSAIDTTAPEFFGFDYVLEPNYATNRGWTIDSVTQMSASAIEAALVDEQLHGALTLINTLTQQQSWLQQQLSQTQDQLTHLHAQNTELIAQVARSESRDVFDSVGLQSFNARRAAFAQLKPLPGLQTAAKEMIPDPFFEQWAQRRPGRR